MSKVFYQFSWPKAAFFALMVVIGLLIFLPATGERIITVVTNWMEILMGGIQ